MTDQDIGRADREQAELVSLVDELAIDPALSTPTVKADAYVRRMQAADQRRRVTRRLIGLGTTVAASVALVAVLVLDPWRTQTAVAASPPILDYEFANAATIATAPGVDPRPALRRAAATATRMLPPQTGDPATELAYTKSSMQTRKRLGHDVRHPVRECVALYNAAPTTD